MVQSNPFIDAQTGSLEISRILTEVVPLAKLIGAFAAVALVPFALVYFVGGHSIVGTIVTGLAQFVLAIGTAIVLMYAVSRGIQLAGES